MSWCRRAPGTAGPTAPTAPAASPSSSSTPKRTEYVRQEFEPSTPAREGIACQFPDPETQGNLDVQAGVLAIIRFALWNPEVLGFPEILDRHPHPSVIEAFQDLRREQRLGCVWPHPVPAAVHHLVLSPPSSIFL